MTKRKKKILIALLFVAAVLMAAAAGLSAAKLRQDAEKENFVYVDGTEYPANAEKLDLRGKEISPEHYETLCGKLPQCQILWDVPFQGKKFPSNTDHLTVSSLSGEDAQMLGYFENLRNLDATACRQDYDVLLMLQEKRPRCALSYRVEIGSQILPQDAQTLILTSGESSAQELTERLAWLPDLKTLYLEEPEIPADQLLRLRESYPYIDISWTKTIFGQKCRSDRTFLDLSGEKIKSLQEVEKLTAYLPDLQQVDMLNCGFSNDSMRAFRNRMRSRYKIVFNVRVGTMDLRTDIIDFYPDRDHGKVKNQDVANLRYCEDLICVDVGHLGFNDLSWVEGTPHLKYLIMADSGAQDLTPLGQLQELEFLELFMTGVMDPSPLLTCRSLKDLNLGVTPLVNVEPLYHMTWLKNLWVNRTPIGPAERQRLIESLPNTHIEFDEYYATWGGWRDTPRYFEMRDILRAPYMR